MIYKKNTEDLIEIIINENLDKIKFWLMKESKNKYEKRVKMITDFIIKDLAVEPERLLKQLKRSIDDE